MVVVDDQDPRLRGVRGRHVFRIAEEVLRAEGSAFRANARLRGGGHPPVFGAARADQRRPAGSRRKNSAPSGGSVSVSEWGRPCVPTATASCPPRFPPPAPAVAARRCSGSRASTRRAARPPGSRGAARA